MPLFPEVNPRFFAPQPQAANHSGVALLPPPSPAYPTPPRPPFHTQPSPPLSQGPSSVDYSTRQAGVLLGVYQKHTAVTGMVAGDSTPGPSAPSCPGTGDIFNNLFVPLPNCIETPINIANFVKELEGYPFPDVVDYLVTGFRKGFSLGYTRSRFAITPKNLKSALDNESHVTAAIIKELERKHIAGPFLKPPIEPLHCSPLGAVLKKDDAWCLILDLSSPHGYSVNECISKDEFSVTFSKFDDAVNLVRKLGKGARMAKLDVKHAFRIIPVDPQDWDLLGTFWNGYHFVELRLPFGCRSSVFIFNTFADALAWILHIKHAIANLVHYLDDFFTCGAANTDECARNIKRIIKVFENLGVPLAVDKLIDPVTVITYLGIEIDSDDMSLDYQPKSYPSCWIYLMYGMIVRNAQSESYCP